MTAETLPVPGLTQAEATLVPRAVTGRAAGLHVWLPAILAIFVDMMALGAVQIFGMPVVVERYSGPLGGSECRVRKQGRLCRARRGQAQQDDGQDEQASR